MEKQQYIETVNHLKKKLDKGVSFEKTMHILYKLQKIPISIKLLEATGIGLKIRELSKAEKSNDIGKTAKLLTMTWKDFVRNQPADDDNDDDDDDADDDELEHQEYQPNGRIKEEGEDQDHHHSQEDSPPHSRQNHTSSSHRASSNSSSHHHSKHSKKSSHHHRDREADHQAEVNGHRSSHRITPDSDREEESPPERSSTSSKHKEKKKHKHHHKEKKSKHHKSSKSSSKISDDSEEGEEEEEEIDSTDEAAAELFGAAISASKSKEQRKAEKKARRKEEKKKEEKRRSGDHQESSNVKRIRIKEPVDPNASPSKRIGSQRELTVENGADLFSQMLSTSGSASKLAAQANGSYTPSGKHSSTSASTSSSQKHASSSSSRHQSSSQLASTSSRHPSNSSTTSSTSSSSSANSQLRLSQQSSNKANQALDMLASMNGIKGSSSSSQNSSSSSNSGYLGPDPNYRPAMHRRLDEMIAEGASARARAPPPQATSTSSAQQLHFKSAAAKDSYERANTAGMKLFKGRTAVWSGASRHVTVAKVYPLQELCIRLLMNHLDMIFEVGDLPYYILKPVLEKCTVGQLRRIEYYNPQLCDESDELWNEFVQKEFKQPLKPARFDSWREYYDWQVEARERKLKAITEGISSKARKAVPERKTVTIDVKLPREIRRRQERATNPFYSSSGGSSNRASSSSYSGSSGGGGLGGTAPHSMTAGGMVTLGANKPKTAPLMKKLLQIRKGKGGFKR